MGGITAHREHQMVHDDAYDSQSRFAKFVIVLAKVDLDNRSWPIQAFGLIEADAVFGAVGLVLRRVPREAALCHVLQDACIA